jgi:hypothetical protein
MFPVSYYTARLKRPESTGTGCAVAKVSYRDIPYLPGLFVLDLQCY